MNKLKTRQLCLFFAGFMPLGKLIFYPSFIADVAKNDLLISAGLNLLAEGLVLWALLLLAAKTDKSFFELLTLTFGELTARVIYGIYALFFLLNAVLPICEQSLLLRSAFFDTQLSPLATAPFFLLSLYLCVKGFKLTGRSADLLAPVAIVCLTVMILFGFFGSDFTNLLPTASNGGEIARGALFSVRWFSDGAFLLFFLGHYRHEKGGTAKIMLSYLAGTCIVLLVLGAFYSIFSNIAILQKGGFANIGKYFPSLNILGRMDYILTYLITLPLLFYLVLPLQFSVSCLEECFHWHKRIPLSLIVNAAAAFFTYFVNYFSIGVEAFVSRYLWPIFLCFAYLIPLLAWSLKKHET